MLEGVVPFPPEYAQRYREKGYWRDKSLAEEFAEVFKRFAQRVALIDGERQFTYADIDRISDRLALNLHALGLRSLDRVVVQLPNVAEFVLLYFALQKLGCIPIAALATHRYLEISQFVQLSKARACVYPDSQGSYRFAPTLKDIAAENPCLEFRIVLGSPEAGEIALTELIEAPAKASPEVLRQVSIDPVDPCIFQLSGGTTGVPKLIPRTHNDYFYNSRLASEVCLVGPESILLLALPIAHNLPLACPGIQGFLLKGGRVVLCPSTRPEAMLPLVARHRVTHIKVVPALLIRLINSPEITQHDMSSVLVVQSGGQRMHPEVRLRTRQLIPNCFVQENFGMSEGMLLFVHKDDPEEVRLETVGRPISPDDEVLLLDENDEKVALGEVGEFCARGPYTLRGYYGTPEYNTKAFTPDGFYRSGDLMRQHPSGNYIVEGRKKDLINRGGEKISAEEVENLILGHPAVQNVACVPVSDPLMGEKMCACVILQPGQTLTLETLLAFLGEKGIARYKLPERLEIMEEFPLSKFGKVSKKVLSERVTGVAHPALAPEKPKP